MGSGRRRGKGGDRGEDRKDQGTKKKITAEDVRKYAAAEKQPRPFRIVEFGCRCTGRHFNSGECIICILAARPLRVGTVSPGSNGHRRVSPLPPPLRQTRTARCRALFSPFSRVVVRQIKRETVREGVPETDGER